MPHHSEIWSGVPKIKERFLWRIAGKYSGDSRRDPASRNENYVIGNNRLLVDAAMIKPASFSSPLILGTEVEGEARISDVSSLRSHAKPRNCGNPVRPPACPGGGRTTVTVRGHGVGGEIRWHWLGPFPWPSVHFPGTRVLPALPATVRTA